MKKFILIDHEPWTIRRKQLFYDLFEKAGLHLEVWDISQWLYSGMNNPDTIEKAPYLHKINSISYFSTLLNNVDASDTIFIEEIFRVWKNRDVFRLLAEKGFKTVKIELYGNTCIKEPILHKIAHIDIKELTGILKNKFESFRYKLYNKQYRIPSKPYILFSSNSCSFYTHNFNHPDYERFRFEDEPRIIEEDYIVFCDIYFPYHPDLKYFWRVDNLPEGDKYHQLMKSYFDYLEDKFKLPVVIAAHPKADYKGNEFGNRRIIKYKTDSLVKYSKMVTMHICNTISYAILGDKPIAYIVTNDYLALPKIQRKLDILVNKTLGLRYYNIEYPNYKDELKFEKIDKVRRAKYILDYLTSEETENIPNYKTLYKVLSEL